MMKVRQSVVVGSKWHDTVPLDDVTVHGVFVLIDRAIVNLSASGTPRMRNAAV